MWGGGGDESKWSAKGRGGFQNRVPLRGVRVESQLPRREGGRRVKWCATRRGGGSSCKRELDGEFECCFTRDELHFQAVFMLTAQISYCAFLMKRKLIW